MTKSYSPDNPIMRGMASVFGKPVAVNEPGRYTYTYRPAGVFVESASGITAVPHVRSVTVTFGDPIRFTPDMLMAERQARKRRDAMRNGVRIARGRVARMRRDRWEVVNG